MIYKVYKRILIGKTVIENPDIMPYLIKESLDIENCESISIIPEQQEITITVTEL